ncbi:MAG TPA: pyridoxamine 5'-phosphate oxidase family protein [Roseiflexaceae bacterium]|nr:pyridoxamine 5'-phosphate oxidase family protein [Roseiflexaceae bacterium]
MSGQTIEQWEHTQAELEIRRWLSSIGLWAPGADRAPWQSDTTTRPQSLTAEEIDQVLRAEVIARIGCHTDGKTYVVPIAYAYDGQSIYGQSGEGLKLRMLRANPEVCVEVEQAASLSDWRSVIAWGWFEELRGDAATSALRLLHERLKPLLARDTPAAEPYAMRDDERPVMFRVMLGKRTGRRFSISPTPG